MNKVYVTGIGFITSIGNTSSDILDSLLGMKSGIDIHPDLERENCPVKVAGTIKGFETSEIDPEDWIYPQEYQIRRDTIRSFSPHVLYAWCAMQQAIKSAGLKSEDISNPDTGIYTASGGSMGRIHHHLQKMENHGVMSCNPMGIVASISGTLTFNFVSALKIRGFSCGQVSACASSGHSLGFAFDEIRRDRQKRMFVVGAEDCDFSSIAPFCGMRALSLNPNPAHASKPFDANRQGFVSTGGGIVLVLESEEEVERRGVRPYAEIAGWGQGSDGHNVAISHPEGAGLIDAIHRAIEDSDLGLEDIGYINAHATGTSIGDLSEIKAIRSVFGDLTSTIPVSSTKAITGHGLSLSSVMEVGFCCISLREGFLPGSANIDKIDPEAETLNVIRETVKDSPDYILSNSSGFGGANVSVVLKRVN
jgi:3-oxoacyl-[acyl-carrier-protein] synthase I